MWTDWDGPIEIIGLGPEEAKPTRATATPDGTFRVTGVLPAEGVITLRGSALELTVPVRAYPGWLALLPPLGAIFLAVLSRQVLVALFAGTWIGALILARFDPLEAFLRSTDHYVVGALADSSHAFILVFSLSLAGLVGVLNASGGIQGVVDVVSRWARTARSGQLATWLLGLLIFFDDYANSLILGNTMRPFTDRVRISREKLSFIVDATAAPVATIGVISTWTAYQLGLISDEFKRLDGAPEPYLFFLSSIPGSFYSLFMIAFVFLSAVTLRDFGPMRTAENRARLSGEVLRPGAQPLVDSSLDELHAQGNIPPRWWNAVLPLGGVIGFTLLGLWATGIQAVGDPNASLRDIIAHADSYAALLWSSFGATALALLLVRIQGMPFHESIAHWTTGVRSLVLAAMILILAWSISQVSKELHTGNYVAALVGSDLEVAWFPAIAFIAAGVIAFATGTSYGTMGILIPIFLPLVFQLGAGGEFDRLGPLTLAGVLGGAVFGDHCSPISDTTVLSSMAAGADHIDHVRTQLPYALLVALVALLAYIAAGFGLALPWAITFGLVLLVALFWGLSRPVVDPKE